MERITITIDDDLLAEVDALVVARGYTSRSEAIREMLRESAKHAHLADGAAPCVATLTYVYNHALRDLPQRLVDAQHEHHDLSVATTHVHFGHEDCLEVAILRGPAASVQRHADALTAQRGVRHAHLHLIPVPGDEHEHNHGGHTHRHGAP
jgi:CopG family nickel-responsive transcriptional regulator